MPDLTGMTLKEAEEAVASISPSCGLISSKKNSSKKPGTVIHQSPAAGTTGMPTQNGILYVEVTIAK